MKRHKILLISCVVFVAGALLAATKPGASKRTLLVNGYPLALSGMNPEIRGTLSLASGVGGKKQPFLAYIRRDGKIIDSETPSHVQLVTVADLGVLLRNAMPGDELVVDAVDGERMKITLTPVVQRPPFQWFYLPKLNGDGC